MVKQLSPQSRQRIQSLHKTGKTNRTIARMLNCSPDTVDRWIHAAQIINSKKRNKGFAKAPIITPKLRRAIDQFLDDRRNSGSRTLTPLINKRFKIDISAASIRRFQKVQGFTYGADVQKPYLTEAMKKDRLKWATTHLKDNFRRFIYSDSKIFRIGTKGARKRQRGPRHFVAKDKYAGQCHIWWAFSYNTIYPPQVITGNLNAQGYVNILQKTLGKDYDSGNILIQDKASCNRSVLAKNWLDEHHIKYFADWPTKGIDLNVIENVWGTLELDKRAKDFHAVDKMQKYVLQK